MLKFYTNAASGNAYKVAILLSLLEVPHEKIAIDLSAGQSKEPAFRALSPRAEIPVVEEGGLSFWDSSACLVYIARRFGGSQWYPEEAADVAEIAQWLALAGNEIQFGLQYARRNVRRKKDDGEIHEQYVANGRLALSVLEGRLAKNEWVALRRLTIADIACFPYVALAPDAGIDLAGYVGVSAWLDRCKSQPGWPAR
jgi:glutathione S-transferase